MRLGVSALNAGIDGQTPLLDGGTLQCFAGPLPATLTAPLTAEQVRLAVVGFASPAFNRAVDGIALSRPMAASAPATVGGRLAWYRMVTRAGVIVADGIIGSKQPFDLLLPWSISSRGCR
jgi:hypothetical protein